MTSESLPPFATVRRGYEPTQVDSYVRQVLSQLDYSRGQADELARSLEQSERARVAAESQAEEGSAYAGLGERIEGILTLAEEEAGAVRASAVEEAAQTRRLSDEAVQKQRAETERFVEERRREAQAQAERVLEEAQQQAEQVRDEAARDAAVRREQAEAVFETQRAKAAQAAADFETGLAERRERAEREFAERTAAAERRATELQQHAQDLHLEAESVKLEADKRAARLVEEARTQAAELVQEAKARAERIRVESERELVAATQRRDSINAQLSNVRRMLATLGGASLPGGLGELAEAGPEQPQPVAPVEAQDEAVLGTSVLGEDDVPADDVEPGEGATVIDLTRAGSNPAARGGVPAARG